MLESPFVPGLLHENSPHRLSRSGEEMAAALPAPRLNVIGANQPQIRFMNESCGIKRLSGFFVGEFLHRQTSQFGVDDG
jgi:hypothetical protein